MAIPFGNAAAGSSSSSFEKASAFVNLYMPTKEGGRVKIGAIPLREGKPTEKKILTWLLKDPKHVEELLEKLIIDFREVKSEAADLDL